MGLTVVLEVFHGFDGGFGGFSMVLMVVLEVFHGFDGGFGGFKWF